MKLEEMVSLIRQVWSDSMSDDGSIWAVSNAHLNIVKLEYPELYSEALPIAQKLGIGF
jgi:propanediol utilization protein